jgi:hypothetical protein
MMTDNEVLDALRSGSEPFVTAGLARLGPNVAKLAAARINRGELAVRIETLFGAQLHANCQIIDESGAVAYEFALDGLQRIVVDGKAN